MSKSLFVIVDYGETCSVLGLQRHDVRSAQRSINWQRRGDNRMPMHICTYEGGGLFKAINTGTRFRPSREPFTIKAWDEFINALDRST